MRRPAPRPLLPVSMAAATAAVALTATLGSAPAAQATQVPHAAGIHRDPGVGPDPRTTPAIRSRSPRPTSQTSTGSPRSSSVTAPGTCTPSTSPADQGSRAGPTTPAPRSTPRPRWPRSTPTGWTPCTSARATPGSPTSGGYQAIAPNGGDQWYVPEANPGTDPTPRSGVSASLTVGAYAGGYGVEAGSLGQNTYRPDGGGRRHAGRVPVVLGGLGVLDRRGGRPLLPTATARSSAAATRARGPPTGRPTATVATSGSSRVPGNAGTGNPAGGLICQYDTTQNIDRSSPAVGQFLSGGGVGIAIGDGSYYSGASDSDKVFALNTGCGVAWSDTLNGITADSPALADVQGNGQLDVVEGTQAGTIYVLERHQRRGGVVRNDHGAGLRLTGDRRPHRWWLPGRHRPDDRRDRHLRRALGRRGGHHRSRLRVPELAARDRRPRRPHRDHGRGLQQRQSRDDRALGDRQHRRLRVERVRDVAHGRSSTTIPSSPGTPAPRHRRRSRSRATRRSAARTATCCPPPTAACSTTATSRSAGRPAAST